MHQDTEVLLLLYRLDQWICQAHFFIYLPLSTKTHLQSSNILKNHYYTLANMHQLKTIILPVRKTEFNEVLVIK